MGGPWALARRAGQPRAACCPRSVNSPHTQSPRQGLGQDGDHAEGRGPTSGKLPVGVHLLPLLFCGDPAPSDKGWAGGAGLHFTCIGADPGRFLGGRLYARTGDLGTPDTPFLSPVLCAQLWHFRVMGPDEPALTCGHSRGPHCKDRPLAHLASVLPT